MTTKHAATLCMLCVVKNRHVKRGKVSDVLPPDVGVELEDVDEEKEDEDEWGRAEFAS